MRRVPRVILLISTARSYERGILRGICQYTKLKGPWVVYHPPHVYLEPKQSTDIIHIEDPAVAQAIRFIWDYSARPINVADVLNAVSVSLRTLQYRFHKVLGRTIHEEITRARMERVAQMLVQTDLSIKKIAIDLGYSGPKHIARVFRNERFC